jgi:hypothetical protein
VGANREYKDSVFKFLFSDPDILRELYGALEGIVLPPDTRVTISTLDDALYKGRLNDIAFVINDKLVVLIEHQSTINRNMPLRLLLYAARIYEKIIKAENMYEERLVKIARPEFIVLYNGTDACPDRKILRLSDAFKESGGLGLANPEFVDLELTVRVYNINNGRNEDMLRKSGNLWGYSVFIGKAREFEEQTGDRNKAMNMAVNWCIEHNILKNFLRIHGSEVVNMLLNEWNWEDALRSRERSGERKGEKKGVKKGERKGEKKGMKKRDTEIARNALAEGIPVDIIQKITGMDIEAIKKLADG